MKPSVSVIMLGVDDFDTSLRFYRDGLKFPTDAMETDSVAFFDLDNIIIALYPRAKLAKDAGVASNGAGFDGVTLAHNAVNTDEVDRIFRDVSSLGVRIVKPPGITTWGGYGGYFADPDGHLWEVVYNPKWKITDEGKATRNKSGVQ